MTWIKICGVTRVADAEFAAEAGADALGLNFVPTSKRCISLELGADIARRLAGRVELVAVVADASPEELARLRDALGEVWLQLHGDEPPEALSPLLPRAFKAVAVESAADVQRAARYPGERLLVDSRLPGGGSGGGGIAFDWDLARPLVADRPVIVAGGLRPDNVAEAVRALSPFGVDVASGVESAPGVKDPQKVRAFVRAARGG